MGPTVSRAKALDTGAELRKRITGHERVMVLNDEAHHLWDPGSAANEAISYLHETIASRTGAGLVAQLDFSATPKDDGGRIFQHVVCDTPLGEAVDGGIVKTPIIGRGKGWVERTSTDASERFEEQLRVGYARWLKSKEEWQASGKKPLLFVMTEDTEAANKIAHRLNTDAIFKELNGKTTNLHTNQIGMASERKEAVAIRDDRGHGSGKSNRAPAEYGRDIQGVERQDDEPAHESQGQGEVGRRKEERLSSFRGEREGNQR